VTTVKIGPETVRAWSVEMGNFWIGTRVRRVEGADSWIALDLHPRGWLLCSWHPENCGCGSVKRETVDRLRKGAIHSPPILLALKSHLSGAVLAGAEQLNADRVLLMKFVKPVGLGISRERMLILEASMRFSNLVLADEKRQVLETARGSKPAGEAPNRNRPGFSYLPPPEVGGMAPREWPDDLSPATLKALRGIGKGLIECLQSNWQTLEDPGGYLKSLYSADHRPSTGNFLPQRFGKSFLVFPVLLPGAEKLEGTPLEAAGSRIAEGLLDRASGTEGGRRCASAGRKVRQLQHRLEGLRVQLAECEQAELWKQRGEALLAGSEELPDGVREVEARFWGEHGEQTILIPVDPRLSRIENAQACFRRYRKGKEKKERVQREILKTEQEIRCLEQDELLSEALSIGERANRGGKPYPAGKKTAKGISGVRRFDIGGFPVFVGTSAKSNREVTFRLASPEDLWFHAKGIPGAHVILKTGKRPVPRQVVEAAASIAAFFSKARTNPSTIVEMTEKRHVKPTGADNPGEVIVSHSEVLTVTARLPDEGFSGSP